jgi:hypothetical protein
MGFSPLTYNKMVETGEVSICPHFCKCVMCSDEVKERPEWIMFCKEIEIE